MPSDDQTGLPPLPAGFQLTRPQAVGQTPPMPAGFQPARPSAQQMPTLTRQERTWGEAVEDTGRGLMSGFAGLGKAAGDLAGLATGNMDNWLSRAGASAQDYWQEGQSDALKQMKLERSEKIDQADGVLGKAGTAIWETVKSPALLTDMAAENIATLIPSGAAGRGAAMAATKLAPKLTRGTVAGIGTGAAVGVGGVQQGTDVASEAYGAALKDTDWKANPEFQARTAAGEDAEAVKKDLALGAARTTMAGATAVSVGSQFAFGPGGRAVERVLAGSALKNAKGGVMTSVAKGMLGEAAQEATEEGGGQFVGNLVRQQTLDPNVDLAEGVGEAAGLGAVGGALFGGPAGVLEGLRRPQEQASGNEGQPPPAGSGPGPLETPPQDSTSIDAALRNTWPERSAEWVQEQAKQALADINARAETEGLAPEDVERRDFIAANIDNVQALADRLAVRLAPESAATPKSEGGEKHITRGMARTLMGQGFEPTAIRGMTYEQAQQIIEAGTRADAAPEAPKQSAPETPGFGENGAPPWVNAQTGETVEPTAEMVVEAVRQRMQAQRAVGGSGEIDSAALAAEWGIPVKTINRARNTVLKRMPESATAPREKPAEVPAGEPEPPQAALDLAPPSEGPQTSREQPTEETPPAPAQEAASTPAEETSPAPATAQEAEASPDPESTSPATEEHVTTARKVPLKGRVQDASVADLQGEVLRVAALGHLAGSGRMTARSRAVLSELESRMGEAFVSGSSPFTAALGAAVDRSMAKHQASLDAAKEAAPAAADPAPGLPSTAPAPQATGDQAAEPGAAQPSTRWESMSLDALRDHGMLAGMKHARRMGRERLIQELAAADAAHRAKAEKQEKRVEEWREQVNGLQGKKPWEMTRAEWQRARSLVTEAVGADRGLDMSGTNSALRAFQEFFGFSNAPNGNGRHEVAILHALERGESIPERVLEEYRGDVDAYFKYDANNGQMLRGLIAKRDRKTAPAEPTAESIAPNESDAAGAPAGEAGAATSYPITEHTTGKGKVLRGTVRRDLTHEQAKAIDPYTMRKDGGYFIREAHFEKLAELDAAQEAEPDPQEQAAEESPPPPGTARAERRARRKNFTYRVTPADGGFTITSPNGGGTVLSGRPRGPSILDTTPPRVFSTETAARDYMAKHGMTEAASTSEREASAEAAPQEPTAPDPFAGNTLFTSDKVAAARERLRAKLGTLNSGIDPEMLIDGMTIAGAYVESGVRNFGQYAARMVEALGDGIKPYLLSFWEAARNYPGLDTKGMTSVDESREQFEALVTPQVAQEAAPEAVGTTVKRPTKRTRKTGAAQDQVLTQDWGTDQIDGYSADANRESGTPTKDAFLKEAKQYVGAVAKELEAAGYEPHLDRKGKPGKAVSVNEGGPAGSGDVWLSMRHPDTGMNIHMHVGASSLRGVIPTTPSGIAIMARTSAKEGDRSATAGTNQWLPVDLSAADLAALLIDNARATMASRARANTEGKNDGNREHAEEHLEQPGAEQEADARGAEGDTGSKPASTGNGGQVRPAEQPPERGGSSGAVRDPAEAVTPKPAETQEAPAKAGVSASSTKESTPPPAIIPASDFTITNELDFAGVGAVGKFNGNIAAIKLLKKLEAEGRKATADEQSVLARYVGWGGLPQAFRNGNRTAKGWEGRVAELEELLTPEELAAAGRSTQDAHYTAKNVVDAMWRAVSRLGFNKGRVLEPSMGTGNFFGLMPHGLRAASSMTGVELDSITGRIAKQLYQNANVQVRGFNDLKLFPDSFDLVIGNPPFGSQSIHDPQYPDLSKWSIHNFFFGKSVASTRPGGVVAMVVSSSFMDANTSTARAWIAERAKLLGAIRLPQTAFQQNAGTNVTTDIIFLQRLGKSEQGNAEQWVKAGQASDQGNEFSLNQYFIDNPSMMLGRMAWSTHTTIGRAGAVLEAHPGQDLDAALQEAIAKLPQDVFTASGKTTEQVNAQVKQGAKVERPVNVKVYGYFVAEDGSLRQRMPDIEGKQNDVVVEKNAADDKRIRGQIGIRNAARWLLAQESTDAAPEVLDRLRQKLNDAYDSYVKEFGPLTRDTNKRAFREDSDSYLLLSLEKDYQSKITPEQARKKADGTEPRAETVKKADIFTKRVNYPVKPVTRVEDAQSAMFASLNEKGRLDMDYMTGLYPGKDEQAIETELGDLVFRTPEGELVPRDAYLSGNVKAKLAAARAAAATDPAFQRHVAALEAVIPVDVDAADIFVQIGTPWIPVEDWNAFAAETFEGSAKGSYMKALGKWGIRFTSDNKTLNHERWGTERMGAAEIVEALMTDRAVVVKDRGANRDDPPVVNQAETAAALGKAQELQTEFVEWLWKDADRRERLMRFYNDTFNTDVRRVFDGSHMTFPGMNGSIEMRPHQGNFIYRAVQDGTVLADHVVGAGKTFAAIAAVMEQRRIGNWRKPMIVVPNHLVEQWATDFARLYPGANILAAGRKDFEKGKRQQLFARIATGDWDAVIVAHSSFGFIPVPAEAERDILKQEVKEIEDALDAVRDSEGKNSLSFKQMQKRKEALDTKITKLNERKRDDIMDFAEMGVDSLVLDEAHEFKNLFFVTSKRGAAGLGSPEGSKKAFDLYVKTRMLAGMNGGKNRMFLTGTPVSNSLSEIFHMQRYLQREELEARSVGAFDAWLSVFGQVSSDWEMDAAGRFKEKTRFRKLANLPELVNIWRQVADVVVRQQLIDDAKAQGKTFPLPKIKGGKPQNIVVPRSPQQAAFIGIAEPQLDENGKQRINEETGEPLVNYPQGSIIYRMDNMPKDPSEDNYLKATSDARKAGLDFRLIDESAPDFPDSKINVAVRRILDRWKKNDHRKGTQLVFCDLSVPASARGKATEAAQAKRPTWFAHEDGAIEHVPGVKVSLAAMPEGTFFTVKGKRDYTLYEAKSGRRVATGRSKQETIDDANAKIAESPDIFRANIERLAIPAEQIDAYVQQWEERQADQDANEEGGESADAGVSMDELLADQGNSKFSVYDDMKAKLIAGGMPANQIAFIHDYNTDAQKQALFGKVKSGEIRVLFGSTMKMGAGMNVQDRLVGLTHMDAPWKPSDLEQREGRIIRQGNNFVEENNPEYDPEFEIEIDRMATAETYDARMWEIIQTKAEGIEAFKAGDAGTREIEDISSEAANAADMKASSSGNPLILESIKLRREIKEIEAQERSFNRSRNAMESLIRSVEGGTTWGHRDLAEARDVASKLDTAGPFALELGGKTYTDRKNLKTETVAALIKEAASKRDAVDGGTFRGARILFDGRLGMGVTVHLTVGSGAAQHVGQTTFAPNDTVTASGFITRLENIVAGAAKRIDNAQARIKQSEKEATQAREDVKRGFPRADALKTKRERAAKVLLALKSGKRAVDGDPVEPKGPTAQFSRPEPAATGGLTSVTQVRAAVRQVLDGWKGDKPVVHVVGSLAEARMLGANDLPATDPGKVEGFYSNGRVFIIAPANASVPRALEVLAHEAIGHYGIERILGAAEWNRIVADVERLRGKTEADVSPKVWKALQSAERRYGRASAEPADKVTFAKEFMAIMAEQGVRTGLTSRVMAAIRKWLGKLGIPLNFTRGLREAELLTALHRGREHVTRGREDPDTTPLNDDGYLETTVHALDLTDAMRSAALEGQPLFSKRDSAREMPSGVGALSAEQLDVLRQLGILSDEQEADLSGRPQGEQDERPRNEWGQQLTTDEDKDAYLRLWGRADGELSDGEQAGTPAPVGKGPRSVERLVRRLSESATRELAGVHDAPRDLAVRLGPFSGYQTTVRIKNKGMPQETLVVEVRGKEQIAAGLDEEPALTWRVHVATGELDVNGPSPDGSTFREFQKRGWADHARGQDGQIAVGWTALRNPDGSASLPTGQILPMLADVHARYRALRKEDRVGLHWSRMTGATGGVAGRESAVYFSRPEPETRTQGVPAAAGEPVHLFRNAQPLKLHPRYQEAKAGDMDAAVALVSDLAGPLVEKTRQFGPDAIYVAPHAEEAAGRNKIPQGMADYLAYSHGANADTSIVQTNRAFHTGAKMMERLLARSEFAGEVQAGGRYVLVDDVTTGGSTLADLAGYIQANGGEVVGTVVLSNGAREGGMMHAAPKLLRDLERRFGNEIRELFHIDPAALTASEARYLIGFRTADELRNRATAAGQERIERLRTKGIRLDEAGVTQADSPAPQSAGPSRSGALFSRPDPNPEASPQSGASSLSGNERPIFDRMQEAMRNPGRTALEFLKDQVEQWRPKWLGALTLRQLAELGEKYLPQIGIYSDLVQKIATDRNVMQEEAAGLAESWQKWAKRNRAQNEALVDLMHEATIAGVDPAEEYADLAVQIGGQELPATRKNIAEAIKAVREQMRGRGGDAKKEMFARIEEFRGLPARNKRRRAAHATLAARWQALTPEAQAMYRNVRDMYVKRQRERQQALIGRIRDMKMDGNRKQAIINRLRRDFESNAVKGVYFPLNRVGDFWIAAKDPAGVPTFIMRESYGSMQRGIKELVATGFTITANGRKGEESKHLAGASESFVADVIGKLREVGAPDAVQDDVWQMYLQTLPDMSQRKRQIHRKKTAGFSRDAIRAFGSSMLHEAHQIARMRYSHQMTGMLDVMKEHANARRGEDDVKTVLARDALLGEMNRRHDWIMNPQDSKVTNLIGSVGFIYYLGLTPAAALVNLTQVAQTTLPALAANPKIGGVKAMNLLLAGMRDSMRTGGNIQRTLTNPDEQRAYQTLREMGAIDKTLAHNLAGIAEGDSAKFNPTWAKVMNGISYLFHTAEVVNREATGLAAYRAARGTGMSFDEAVKYASDMIWQTHFDYSNAQRARWMQGNITKVLLMFRQYSQNMTWFLARNAWQTFKGESPEVRKQALKTLAGTLGTTAIMAGTLGLPLIKVVFGALNAAAASFGDDDEPWDAETEFRNFLADHLGHTAARVITDGPTNVLTGANVASRVGLDDLWFRDSDRELEGRDAFANYLEQIAGPVGGIGKNLLVGKALMDEGHFWRGTEMMLPKAFKDSMKGMRFAAQGVNTLRGDPIVDDLSLWESILQVSGFNPARVAERYEATSAMKNYEDAIINRRQSLMGAYAMALRLRDQEGMREIMEKINRFNAANPDFPISNKGLRQSIRARLAYSARAENGIVLNKSLAGRSREQGRFAEDRP